jgi:putative transposase
MDEYETLNHDVGLQISRCFHPEISTQAAVSGVEETAGRGFSSACGSERIEGRRGAFASGPCSHAFVPPKYAVSNVVGYIKGKSAIHMARTYGERKRNFVGQSFWARGYFVSTVGRDEKAIREYIQSQEKEDQRLEQLNLWK